MTRERLALYSLIAVGALQAPLYYTRLPRSVATHFDFAGAPDGWMSRGGYAAISSAVVLVVGGILIGVFALLGRLPDRYFNLPHRDYWLAPERRPSTIAFFDRQLSRVGIATILLLIVLTHFVIRANLTDDPRLPANLPWILLGIYLILVFVPPFRMLRVLARGGAVGGFREAK